MSHPTPPSASRPERAERSRGRAGPAARSAAFAAVAGPLLAACVAVSACASGGAGGPRTMDGAAEDDRLLVRVENDTDFQVRVQLVSEVQVASLGTVSPLSSATLEVPGALTGTNRRYRLQADPVGSIACFLSDDVFAGPGDVIEWRLFGRPGATCRR